MLLNKHGFVVPKTTVIGARTMGGGIALNLASDWFCHYVDQCFQTSSGKGCGHDSKNNQISCKMPEATVQCS
jgi:hypothetical protein